MATPQKKRVSEKRESGMGREVVLGALRVLGYLGILGFLSFMLAPVMMSDMAWLRIGFNAVILFIACALFYVEGSYKGERDCVMGELLDKRHRETGYIATSSENAKRYHVWKGMASALLGVLPIVLIAVYVALRSELYTYHLQDVPGWMASYQLRPEIGNALAYYAETVPVGAVEYLRIVVRFVLLPFVYMVGEMSDRASLLFDRLMPLILLVLPLCNGVGYLFGPRRRKKTAQFIEEAKRKPRRRLKKSVAQKRKSPEKNQLV